MLTEPAKPLLRALAGEALSPPPWWLMRQAGRYLPEYRKVRARAHDFVELCLTPELAAELTLQPIRRYAMDGAILFSDILMLPHALGQKLAFHEGEGPVLERIEDPAGVARLDPGRIASALDPVFETARRVRGALDPRTTLIGFAGAPWTVATYMVEGGGSRDFRRVKSWAYRDPQAFDALVDLLAEATIEYLTRPNRGWRRGRAAVRQLGRNPARTGFRALGDRADEAHRSSIETSLCQLPGDRFSARRRRAA